MKQFFTNLFAGSNKSLKNRTAGSARRVRLDIESLEERCTPSGGLTLDMPTVVDTYAGDVAYFASGWNIKANVRR